MVKSHAGLGHVVHVLTRQARDYYQLEAKWLGLDRSRATGVRRSRYRGLKRVDIVTDRDAQGAVKTAYEVVRYRCVSSHARACVFMYVVCVCVCL